jgi:hypothetical protein
MILLENESRYSDIIVVFEIYVSNLTISSSYQKPILDSHIEIYSKSLYELVNLLI